MRTNIEIDDALMGTAMQLSGLATKRATVEEGLKLLIRLRRQAAAVEGIAGIGWQGDLEEMRQPRQAGADGGKRRG